MHLESLLSQLREELNQTPFLISVSGGVDSMVLLHALKELKPVVVHFNHHKRKASIKDEQFVSSFCLNEGLSLITEDIHVTHGNFQSEAHHQRQNKLIEIAKKHQITHVLTAHHLDDHVETLLMQIQQHGNKKLNIGLKEKNIIKDVIFYKPLLTIEKKHLYDYAKNHHLNHVEDVSNQKNIYTRNTIRNRLLPKLYQVDPNIKEKIIAYLQRVHKIYPDIQHEASTYVKDTLSKHELSQCQRMLLREVIYQWLLIHHITPKTSYIEDVIKGIHNKKPNFSILLEKNQQVLFSYDTISIQSLSQQNTLNQDVLEGNILFDNKHVSIFFDNKPNHIQASSEICYNKLIFPLTVRYRKAGDVLSFHYGHKKLKNHLIDIKYPKHLRDSLLVIEDQQQTIVFVEDVYINKTLGDSHTLYLALESHDDTRY